MDVWHAIHRIANTIGERNADDFTPLTYENVLRALDEIERRTDGEFATQLSSYNDITKEPCWTGVWTMTNGVRIRVVLEVSCQNVFVMKEGNTDAGVYGYMDIENMVAQVLDLARR